jgi:hypothetical protein
MPVRELFSNNLGDEIVVADIVGSVVLCKFAII